ELCRMFCRVHKKRTPARPLSTHPNGKANLTSSNDWVAKTSLGRPIGIGPFYRLYRPDRFRRPHSLRSSRLESWPWLTCGWWSRFRNETTTNLRFAQFPQAYSEYLLL